MIIFDFAIKESSLQSQHTALDLMVKTFSDKGTRKIHS